MTGYIDKIFTDKVNSGIGSNRDFMVCSSGIETGKTIFDDKQAFEDFFRRGRERMRQSMVIETFEWKQGNDRTYYKVQTRWYPSRENETVTTFEEAIVEEGVSEQEYFHRKLAGTL